MPEPVGGGNADGRDEGPVVSIQSGMILAGLNALTAFIRWHRIPRISQVCSNCGVIHSDGITCF
jgi:hypothetical protein